MADKLNGTSFRTPDQSRNRRLHSAPKCHQVPLFCGGLNHLIEGIKNGTLRPENSSFFTDKDGSFCPRGNVPLLVKRYRFMKILGRGVSAVVIRARDTFRHNYQVAIKIMNVGFFDLGCQEADCIRRLNQADPQSVSGTIRLLNTFKLGDHFCMVYEPLNPKPLHHYFSGKDPAEKLPLIRRVAAQLMKTLGFLQSQDVIHADVKPENILCAEGDPNGNIKLIDFGNAIHCIYDELALYYDDYELQTVVYRAPEVMCGLQFGPEVDLWSVGCVLAELYMGQPLFWAQHKEGVLDQVHRLLGPLPTHNYQRGKFFRSFQHLGGAQQPYIDSYNKLRKRLGDTTCGDFVSFLLGLLRYDAGTRMTIQQAMQHPFLAPEVGIGFTFQLVQGSESYRGIAIQPSEYTFTPHIPLELRNKKLDSIHLLRLGTASRAKMERAVAQVLPFSSRMVGNDVGDGTNPSTQGSWNGTECSGSRQLSAPALEDGVSSHGRDQGDGNPPVRAARRIFPMSEGSMGEDMDVPTEARGNREDGVPSHGVDQEDSSAPVPAVRRRNTTSQSSLMGPAQRENRRDGISNHGGDQDDSLAPVPAPWKREPASDGGMGEDVDVEWEKRKDADILPTTTVGTNHSPESREYHHSGLGAEESQDERVSGSCRNTSRRQEEHPNKNVEERMLVTKKLNQHSHLIESDTMRRLHQEIVPGTSSNPPELSSELAAPSHQKKSVRKGRKVHTKVPPKLLKEREMPSKTNTECTLPGDRDCSRMYGTLDRQRSGPSMSSDLAAPHRRIGGRKVKKPGDPQIETSRDVATTKKADGSISIPPADVRLSQDTTSHEENVDSRVPLLGLMGAGDGHDYELHGGPEPEQKRISDKHSMAKRARTVTGVRRRKESSVRNKKSIGSKREGKSADGKPDVAEHTSGAGMAFTSTMERAGSWSVFELGWKSQGTLGMDAALSLKKESNTTIQGEVTLDNEDHPTRKTRPDVVSGVGFGAGGDVKVDSLNKDELATLLNRSVTSSATMGLRQKEPKRVGGKGGSRNSSGPSERRSTPASEEASKADALMVSTSEGNTKAVSTTGLTNSGKKRLAWEIYDKLEEAELTESPQKKTRPPYARQLDFSGKEKVQVRTVSEEWEGSQPNAHSEVDALTKDLGRFLKETGGQPLERSPRSCTLRTSHKMGILGRVSSPLKPLRDGIGPLAETTDKVETPGRATTGANPQCKEKGPAEEYGTRSNATVSSPWKAPAQPSLAFTKKGRRKTATEPTGRVETPTDASTRRNLTCREESVEEYEPRKDATVSSSRKNVARSSTSSTQRGRKKTTRAVSMPGQSTGMGYLVGEATERREALINGKFPLSTGGMDASPMNLPSDHASHGLVRSSEHSQRRGRDVRESGKEWAAGGKDMQVNERFPPTIIGMDVSPTDLPSDHASHGLVRRRKHRERRGRDGRRLEIACNREDDGNGQNPVDLPSGHALPESIERRGCVQRRGRGGRGTKYVHSDGNGKSLTNELSDGGDGLYDIKSTGDEGVRRSIEGDVVLVQECDPDTGYESGRVVARTVSKKDKGKNEKDTRKRKVRKLFDRCQQEGVGEKNPLDDSRQIEHWEESSKVETAETSGSNRTGGERITSSCKRRRSAGGTKGKPYHRKQNMILAESVDDNADDIATSDAKAGSNRVDAILGIRDDVYPREGWQSSQRVMAARERLGNIGERSRAVAQRVVGTRLDGIQPDDDIILISPGKALFNWSRPTEPTKEDAAEMDSPEEELVFI